MFQHELGEYTKIDRTIRSNEESAILYRWRFGQMILRERDGKKQLPNGRLKNMPSRVIVGSARSSIG